MTLSAGPSARLPLSLPDLVQASQNNDFTCGTSSIPPFHTHSRSRTVAQLISRKIFMEHARNILLARRHSARLYCPISPFLPRTTCSKQPRTL